MRVMFIHFFFFSYFLCHFLNLSATNLQKQENTWLHVAHKFYLLLKICTYKKNYIFKTEPNNSYFHKYDYYLTN